MSKLVWTDFECDADMRVKEASVSSGDVGVALVVSQCAEADWKWTYHLEFDGLVEPELRVDDEAVIKQLARVGAIEELRKLLAALEACE